MPLGTGRRKSSLSAPRGDETHDTDNDADETVVTPEQGSILSHLISQLRPGADLSRITLPTFILEPRSMLERITNFMAHPEILLPMPSIEDPVQRFVAVTKFYLSGWHVKPPGVKKPLNPILGEIFTGYWDYPDGTHGYYIAEQTSHHPPKSSYFFMSPEHKIRIDGTLKPRSKFLGNSVASMMEGLAVMRFLNRGERYFITQPNMYARGILFGKMKYELGDHATVRCPETGLEADIEFKVKGWMGGTYNAVGGFIKDSKSGKNLYELSGFWHREMYIKDLATGQKELIFDATTAKPTFPRARPLSEQSPRESQRLWDSTTRALKKADQKSATDEKTRIEDEQRKEASDRGEGSVWQPKLFTAAPPGDEEELDWIIHAHVDDRASPEKQTEQILAIAPILPAQSQPQNTQQQAKQLPAQSRSQDVEQQIKPLPSPPQEGKALPPPPPQGQSGADLIDFGQHDDPSSRTSQPKQPDLADGMKDMSILDRPLQDQPQQQPVANGRVVKPQQAQQPPQQPSQRPTRSSAGNPVRRMDSMGNEDTFIDAEM